jgi:hypothetical protein
MLDQTLSVGQKALWFLHKLAPDSPAYNMALAFRVRTALDLPMLRQALAEVVQRHDMLRTVVAEADGHPVRIVRATDQVELEVLDLPGASDEKLRTAARQRIVDPFRLDEKPPVRAVLLRTADDEAVFLLVAHHILIDAASLVVVHRDVLHAYQALRTGQQAVWPEIPSYQDHVDNESRLLDSVELKELEEYWREVCADAPTALELPTDRPRPPVQRFVGAAHTFRLPDDTLRRLRQAARDARVTPFVFLLGAFQTLLHRYSGQPDFLVGCAATTRRRSERDVVGYFVNSVVYRADINSATTFRDVLESAAAQVRRGMEAQNYPFALLPKALDLPRDPSRTPLFQVLISAVVASRSDPLLDLALDGQDVGRELDFEGLRVAAFDLPPQQEGQFDLTLELWHGSRSLSAVLKYNSDLFEHSTVEQLLRHYHALIEAAVADPDERAARLSMMDDVERRRLLALTSGTDHELPDW